MTEEGEVEVITEGEVYAVKTDITKTETETKTNYNAETEI